MALLLSEAEVKLILTMPMALQAVEDSFRRLGDGSAISHPRRRLPMAGKGFMHYMAAADATAKYMGLKIYTASPQGARFIVPLFDAETGDLLALIEADYLGQMRTGAASGVATSILAREDARTAAIIGTGLQARTQLAAVAAVRKLTSIRAFGRDTARRERFAQEMTAWLGIAVSAAASAEEAVRGADILTTSTNSVTPVVEGGWLDRGTHINAIGVNWANRREIDAEAVRRCDLIAADSVEQSKIESGDLIQAFGDDASRWNDVREMADIVSGKTAGRTDRSQITLFKSNGIAIEDIVIAGRIYEAALERKIGRDVPLWVK